MTYYKPDDIETVVNDLDDESMQDLASVLNKLDRLEVDPATGDPRFTNNEMDIIGQFQDLTKYEDQVDAEDSDDPDEDEDDVSALVEHDASAGLPGFTEVKTQQ